MVDICIHVVNIHTWTRRKGFAISVWASFLGRRLCRSFVSLRLWDPRHATPMSTAHTDWRLRSLGASSSPHIWAFLFMHLCVHFDFLGTAPLGQGLFRKPSASKGLVVFSLWQTYLHFESIELREHSLENFNSFSVLRSVFYSPGYGMWDICSTNIWKPYIFCCC